MTMEDSFSTTPDASKAFSASIDASAMAHALSSLNCLRSARRFSLTSSAVIPSNPIDADMHNDDSNAPPRALICC